MSSPIHKKSVIISPDELPQIRTRLTVFAQFKYGSARGWKTRLANALDMSVQQVTNLLNGHSSIGRSILYRFEQLGCDLNWLFTGEGEMEFAQRFGEGKVAVGPVDYHPPRKLTMLRFAGSLKWGIDGSEFFDEAPAGAGVSLSSVGAFIIRIESDSLIDSGIAPYDFVVFDPASKPVLNEVNYLRLKGGKRIVRIVVERANGKLELRCSNRWKKTGSLIIKRETIESCAVAVMSLKFITEKYLIKYGFIPKSQ